MKQLILTCEHGGAVIPVKFKKYFAKDPTVLQTHRALDIGALPLAKKMRSLLKTTLDFCTISRLIVDTNREIGSSTLFSEFMAPLTSEQKEAVLDQYYHPHWKKVATRVRKLASRKQVIHVAVHSMTDFLHGKDRPMQLAVLYKARRKSEKRFATIWIKELRKEFPLFKIARNNPYNGDGEGLTSQFRKEFSEKKYLGLEIEMNQKLLKSLKTEKQSTELADGISASLRRAIELF